MSIIKVVPYVLGETKMSPGAPEPRMYLRSGYFLVLHIGETNAFGRKSERNWSLGFVPKIDS